MSNIELPTEVWCLVLGRLTSYADLKRCIRVSKTFKAIIERPFFDDALFRSGIDSADVAHDQTGKVHPALKAFRIIRQKRDVYTVQLCHIPPGGGSVQTSMYPHECSTIASELATAPAVDRIQVMFFQDGMDLVCDAVINTNGVTVEEVLSQSVEAVKPIKANRKKNLDDSFRGMVYANSYSGTARIQQNVNVQQDGENANGLGRRRSERLKNKS